jgi:hypothetical protein
LVPHTEALTQKCGQGAHINRVYELTGVTKIDVHDGVVRVVGPTNAAVMKARELLEFQQVRSGHSDDLPCEELPGSHGGRGTTLGFPGWLSLLKG